MQVHVPAAATAYVQIVAVLCADCCHADKTQAEESVDGFQDATTNTAYATWSQTAVTSYSFVLWSVASQLYSRAVATW